MGSEIQTYLRLGMHHIADLRGYDHILFVAALTVAYPIRDWRRLLILVTAFTLGHSITLALATLDLVRVDSALVESAIAATIAITGFVTIATTVRTAPTAGDAAGVGGPGQGLRYALAAGFGLIHGLGFSTFLRSLLGAEESLAVPLVSFNVGLECGQLLIVAAVVLLGLVVTRLFRVGVRDWILVVSGGITALGTAMMLERLLGRGAG